MKVRQPKHILKTIDEDKMYTMLDRTNLFEHYRPSQTNPPPYIDEWGSLIVGEGVEVGAYWKQANKYKENDGYYHKWVTYSVVMFNGTHKGVRVEGVDELRPGAFYICCSNTMNYTTTVVAAAWSWDEIIKKGCKLLGYLPTGNPFANCPGDNAPVHGEEDWDFRSQYPTQSEWFRQYKDHHGEAMYGI